MEDGDENQIFIDKNDSELFIDMGPHKHSDKVSNKSGAYNSYNTRNIRNANIFSAKEEALYNKSHSSINSRH